MDAGSRRSITPHGPARLGRIPCRTVFLDAGGVIVLPHRDLVVAALARVGVEVGASTVAPAHYRAVRDLDRAQHVGAAGSYTAALCRALGVPQTQMQDAIDAIEHLADRQRSGEILWSEAAPGAPRMIGALQRAGIKVFVVTNSDGHAAENLRDAHICHEEGRAGSRGSIVGGVIDSRLVGYAKPHPGIFQIALERARADPAATVHVGDTVSGDVAGARAAGIVPIHLDPWRRCRDSEHRHLRSLSALWQHVEAAST